jgi:hypothetical protein
MTAWDPVGSGGIAEAWDEYDDYLLGVAHRLRDAQDPDIAEQALREYVARVEHNWMGMQPTKRADSARASLAEALVAWYEWSWRRGGRPPREWIDDD